MTLNLKVKIDPIIHSATLQISYCPQCEGKEKLLNNKKQINIKWKNWKKKKRKDKDYSPRAFDRDWTDLCILFHLQCMASIFANSPWRYCVYIMVDLNFSIWGYCFYDEGTRPSWL